MSNSWLTGLRLLLAKSRPKMLRRDFILASIDPASQHGIEIGPLNRPIVKPTDGRVEYVDHLPTEALRAKYAADPNVDVAGLMPISYVWGEATLPEAVGHQQFDYVVASHVIEHVPDVISWLAEVSAVLKPGGILALAIPDKRWTFDCRRQLTSFSELIESFLEKRRKPSLRQVIDHFWEQAAVPDAASAPDLWQGRKSFAELPLVNAQLRGDEGMAWLNGIASTLRNGGYIDSHCLVFTPFSFIEILATCAKLGLLDFSVAYFQDTQPDDIEFFLSLRKLPESLTAAERANFILDSLPKLPAPLLDGEVQALRQRPAA